MDGNMKLYKYRSLENIDYTLDIILNERLYCAKHDDLNDPFEGVIAVGDASFFGEIGNILAIQREMDDTNIRICSLSSNLDDVVMWAHYSDNYRGVVIEIDLDKDAPNLKRVNYIEKLTTIVEFTTPEELLTTKAIDWKKEAEYRVIVDEEYYDIKDKVTALYFGIHTSKIHKQIFRSLNCSYKLNMYDTNLDLENIKVAISYDV